MLCLCASRGMLEHRLSLKNDDIQSAVTHFDPFLLLPRAVVGIGCGAYYSLLPVTAKLRPDLPRRLDVFCRKKSASVTYLLRFTRSPCGEK